MPSSENPGPSHSGARPAPAPPARPPPRAGEVTAHRHCHYRFDFCECFFELFHLLIAGPPYDGRVQLHLLSDSCVRLLQSFVLFHGAGRFA
jgi:hypothetical protein